MKSHFGRHSNAGASNESNHGSLESRILSLLGEPKYQPIGKVEISKRLGIKSDERGALKDVLRDLEHSGKIARIRKDCYVLPQSADLFAGIIQFNEKGFAFVLNDNKAHPYKQDLFIPAEDTWTALHGDRVLARIMKGGLSGQKLAKGRRHRDRRGPVSPTAKVEGRVIRILERANQTIVGTLQASKNFHYVVGDDPRFIHNIYVHLGQVSLPRVPQVGDKVVVQLEEWESRHINPEGKIIEVLGPANRAGVDMLSIIRKYHLSEEFPAAVMDAAEQIPEEISEEEIASREDLRDRPIITIDPDDARDFDDAIEVEDLPDGGWRLAVHIADVSHYVTAGGIIDREAFQRGNSVYLADRVIPMLPEVLSNGVCSLKPKVDRLACSVFIDFSPNGKIKSHRFARTVIRSQHRFTYKEAFALLQGPEDASPLANQLHKSWRLAEVLRRNRWKAGALELDMPEVKVYLNERGQPVRMERVENDISHQLIEEFMLVANEVVARELKYQLVPAIYRIHEDPEPERLMEFRDFVQMAYEIRIGDLTHRAELQRLLKMVRNQPEEDAVKIGLLKSLKRAAYDVNPLGHYGLAKANYTHFTSPIRRYADLVVHRSLMKLALNDAKNGGEAKRARIAAGDLRSVASHICFTERMAADAEKESVKLKKLEFFQNQLRERSASAADLSTKVSFPAIIIDIRNYGLLVELPEFVLNGLVHVSELADDFYDFDAIRQRFVGKRNRKVYQIGEKIEVEVANVNMFKRQVDFRPAYKEVPKDQEDAEASEEETPEDKQEQLEQDALYQIPHTAFYEKFIPRKNKKQKAPKSKARGRNRRKK